MAGHNHPQAPMAPMAAPLGISDRRAGSGTSWLPDESPVRGGMRHVGPWMLMAHGNLFLQYIESGSPRGDGQGGSINWLMGMAERDVAGGRLGLRGMMSFEPLTVGRCGYPNLLQTGESCRGEALHDRQHPHDLFMEAAVEYRRAMNETAALGVYAGLAGEPALGPVAFPHRPSAFANPIAPITHHWLDATHVSFGVVTGSVYSRRWKAEASVFNGREPDDARYDFDLGALDSYSGRITWNPSSRWSMQFSSGRLTEAEVDHHGEATDATRTTASATYHRQMGDTRWWTTTLAWGQNREDHGVSNAVLVESTRDLTARDAVFARGEITTKTSDELVLPGDDRHTLGKVQAGYVRRLGTGRGFQWSLGGAVGVGIVPAGLRDAYGSRAPGELVVFATIAPVAR